MESGNGGITSDMIYPILFIPKKCTTLETNCEWTDNVYINVSITSPDTEGNNTSIYNGFCNIKLVDSYDINLNRAETPDSDVPDIEQMPVILSETNQTLTPQSQVWIDPSRSPYVYNHYDPESQEQYSIRESGNTITVEHHNTYITQNVYKCKESNVYNYKEAQSPIEDSDRKRYRKVQETVTNQPDANMSYYEEDELECGVFLSQLSEEIMNEKQARAREEQRLNSISCEDNALKQLMSSDIQSTSKQRKTILFLGQDSQSGQTIQNISYNDPLVQCVEMEVDNEVVIDSSSPNPIKKKYQCDKCKQIFDQISSFRQHMVGNHLSIKPTQPDIDKEIIFICTDCGKNFKNQRKFEIHCHGHGDPDLECPKCHKVFASKFSRRVHMKIHNRKFPCDYCSKSYTNLEELKIHLEKVHSLFMCEVENCSFISSKKGLRDHWHEADDDEAVDDEETELKREVEGLDQDLAKDLLTQDQTSSQYWDGSVATTSQQYQEKTRDWAIPSPSDELDVSNKAVGSDASRSSQDLNLTLSPEMDPASERARKADDVIARVMSNTIFLMSSRKAKRHLSAKTCEVCRKSFHRIDDLKRHLIEHVIKSTLAKNPVSRSGHLSITCEVCQTDTFDRVDKYKAHLREHAKLTIYKCTFCDKSFSDSSNFSKHKKIHGVAYLQCDLCRRKFNSKKMIAQHMEHHNNTSPVNCRHCGRMFHFESMLKKHVRCAHRREETAKYRCRFCEEIFKSLKEKWDHEWTVHSVRKMIVDCRICSAQYRKYSELKRHCLDEHGMDILPATKLLKKRYRSTFKASP